MQEKMHTSEPGTPAPERVLTPKEQQLISEYREKYATLTRGQLSLENHGLYLALYRRKLLDIVPLKFAPFQDPFAVYKQQYLGMTQGQLKVENKRLYDALEVEGLLNAVPTDKRIINDPVMLYHMRYANMTRSQLFLEDRELYVLLKEINKLDIVPKKHIGPLAEYQQRYSGLDQTELRKQAPSVYQRLWAKGLLSHVPKRGMYEKKQDDQAE